MAVVHIEVSDTFLSSGAFNTVTKFFQERITQP